MYIVGGFVTEIKNAEYGDAREKGREKPRKKKIKPVANQHLFYEHKHCSTSFVCINILNLRKALNLKEAQFCVQWQKI